MSELRVLIITDEPIFSFGLRVQFLEWGFDRIEIADNCQLALQSVQKQLPALVVIDEKFIQAQACSSPELIAELHAIPIIFLSVNLDHTRSAGGLWEVNNNYSYLSKPCKIADLKAAVESLLVSYCSSLELGKLYE